MEELDEELVEELDEELVEELDEELVDVSEEEGGGISTTSIEEGEDFCSNAGIEATAVGSCLPRRRASSLENKVALLSSIRD